MRVSSQLRMTSREDLCSVALEYRFGNFRISGTNLTHENPQCNLRRLLMGLAQMIA
jgi:hypothetical protein